MNLKNIKKWNGLFFNYLSSIFSTKSFSEFLNDECGGLVLPISGKAYNDDDFIEYQKLKVDRGMEPIDYTYFPSDFCDKACRLVDEFRRKTVNEEIEWMLYFDYTIGDIIYCWKGKEGKTGGIMKEFIFTVEI